MKPAYSLILSKCLNYSEEAVSYYKDNFDYDLEAAKQLLADAGWSEPFLLMDMFCQRNPECTNPDPEGQEALVAEARKIVDFEKRTEAITELQKKIMDYCTLLPFADSSCYRVWRSEIKGIKYTVNGGFWLNDVETDANGNFRIAQ